MPTILLDENIPFKCVRRLPGWDVRHVLNSGWAGFANGQLVAAADDAGIDVLITADKNLRYQQNWSGRRLCLIVLSTNNWPVIRDNIDLIAAALDEAAPGGWLDVRCEA